MRRWKWLWLVVAVACVAVAFYGGVRFGRTYEFYRFVYAAPQRVAARGAWARLIGREKNYGQFDQDLWVTLGIAPGVHDGYYVDVGSGDGVFFSNTKLLDDLGWKGVCIDPFPSHMASRTCQMFKQVIFSESGKHVQFRKAGLLGGIEQDLNLHKQQVSLAPLVELVTATLDEVLAKAHAPKHINYMNLDVEGAEYDVLRGLSFDQYQIDSLTIEHNYEPAKREAILKLITANGYVRVRSWEVDDWYVYHTLAPRYKNFVTFCTKSTECPEAPN
jgi:FkbM family methyltransferase